MVPANVTVHSIRSFARSLMMYAASNHTMSVSELQAICAQMDNLICRAYVLGRNPPPKAAPWATPAHARPAPADAA